MAIFELPTMEVFSWNFAWYGWNYEEIPSPLPDAHELCVCVRSLAYQPTILICFSPERVQFAGLINLSLHEFPTHKLTN